MPTDYSNIKLDIPQFSVVDDYFYVMYPLPTNMLMKKTNYGDPVATYMLSEKIKIMIMYLMHLNNL